MHAARWAVTLFVRRDRRDVGTSSGLPASAGASPDAGDVLLSDVGPGFTLVSEATNTFGAESLTRRFEHESALLDLTVIPVTTPPGVRAVFGIFSAQGDGFESVPEPALDLAGWLVAPGSQVGDNGDASLVFASRDHLFIFALFTDESAGIDAPAFVRELAQRQVDVAGGPPAARRHVTRRQRRRRAGRRSCPPNRRPNTASRRRRRPPGRTSCRSTTRSSPTWSTS